MFTRLNKPKFKYYRCKKIKFTKYDKNANCIVFNYKINVQIDIKTAIK